MITRIAMPDRGTACFDLERCALRLKSGRGWRLQCQPREDGLVILEICNAVGERIDIELTAQDCRSLGVCSVNV